MGMDLLPRNKEIAPFHANWWGWGYLHTLLTLAGADVSKMAGTNDGLYVDANTARKWGEAILGILPDLREKRTGTESYPVIKVYEGLEEEVADGLLEGIYSLDEDTKKWLKEFAEFCTNSRGFWQY